MIFNKLQEIEKDFAMDNHDKTTVLMLNGKYYVPVKEISCDDCLKEESLFIHIVDIVKK